ncbi:MFS transporter [Alkalilimnicola ehrlichii]|uniref:MFS transporter n=1 Tax=Alkalilimnicola ehrlichii TaxID=351052 RepID=UPI001C6E961B|nr:MFS transporter [Alkalilimnicola ehrlichii]
MSAERRAWWGRHLLFGWVNLALATPVIYLLLGLPLVLRAHGWSGTEIGLLQLTGLPAVFKFALAIPVQRYNPGRYHNWAIGLCLLLIALLVLIAWVQPLGRPGVLFALALLVSVLAAWADVPLNALAIRLFPEPERLRAGSVRSAALFAAAVVGGGLLLVAQERWGWALPFLIMAGMIGAGLPGLLLAERRRTDAPATPSATAVATIDWRGFFHRAARLWSCLLVSLFPFIGAAWLYLKPLLLDQGMPADQVAWIVGVGGGILGAVAGLVSVRLNRVLGVRRSLPLFSAVAVLALATLALLLHTGAGPGALAMGAALIAIAMGMLSALVFALVMYFARPQQRAMDYGLQSSLFTLSRLAVPVAAGLLLDRLGAPGMVACLAVAMLAVLVLATLARSTIERCMLPPYSADTPSPAIGGRGYV